MINGVMRMPFVFLLLVPILLNGTEIGVLHLKSVGAATETAEAVADLFANEILGLRHKVLSTDAMDAAVGEVLQCSETGCAAEAGFKARVERVILGSGSKFGEKYMVQISQKETQEVKRREAFYATGANFVYGFPVHGYANASGIMGGNWVNWYETPNFAVELSVGYLWSLNAIATGQIIDEPRISDYGANISLFYLLLKGDLTPYFGGGMGPRFVAMKAGNQGFGANFGMGFNAGGGLLIFRTYDFHLIIDARYHLNTANIPNYQGPHGAFNLSVGIVFRPMYKKDGCGGCLGGGCF